MYDRDLKNLGQPLRPTRQELIDEFLVWLGIYGFALFVVTAYFLFTA